MSLSLTDVLYAVLETRGPTRLFLEKYISLIQFILLFTNFKFTLFYSYYYHPYSSIIDLKDCMLLLKLDSTEIRNLAKDATLPLEVKQ